MKPSAHGAIVKMAADKRSAEPWQRWKNSRYNCFILTEIFIDRK